MDDEEGTDYRWQSGYEKTWEALCETEEGYLETSALDLAAKASRRQALLRKAGTVRLGIMRHVYIIVDLSECMGEQDLKPTRQRCTCKLLEDFVGEYFDQNPISQLGIIVTRNKRAEKIIELGANQRKIIEAVNKVYGLSCSGEPSLQNSIEMALQNLRNMPLHTSKEIVVIFGSLTTCDPGDIEETIQKLKKSVVRVSIVGLAAEVRVCRHVAKETNGDYGVLLDEQHFKQNVMHNKRYHQEEVKNRQKASAEFSDIMTIKNKLVMAQVEPPLASSNTESTLVKMGFPGLGKKPESTPIGGDQIREPSTMMAMCMCHLDDPTHCKLSLAGYTCPQCASRYCELPVECRACGLTLVSAPHLARSYHHLFPLQPFTERQRNIDDVTCHACLKTYKTDEKHVYVCNTCHSIVCYDCDMFVHDTLHTCPGCSSKRGYIGNMV